MKLIKCTRIEDNYPVLVNLEMVQCLINDEDNGVRIFFGDCDYVRVIESFESIEAKLKQYMLDF